MKLKFNPLYLWIASAWCASKVFQLAMQSKETIWETGWNRFLDVFGNFSFNLRVLLIMCLVRRRRRTKSRRLWHHWISDCHHCWHQCIVSFYGPFFATGEPAKVQSTARHQSASRVHESLEGKTGFELNWVTKPIPKATHACISINPSRSLPNVFSEMSPTQPHVTPTGFAADYLQPSIHLHALHLLLLPCVHAARNTEHEIDRRLSYGFVQSHPLRHELPCRLLFLPSPASLKVSLQARA